VSQVGGQANGRSKNAVEEGRNFGSESGRLMIQAASFWDKKLFILCDCCNFVGICDTSIR
jgi:hypothetical protein